MANLILLTALTGVAGLGLGGLLGVWIGGTSKKFNAMLLSFTAGAMLALICFELLHEAVETGVGMGLIAAVSLGGAALVTFLDYLVDKHSGHSQDFITCEDCDEEFEHDAGHEHCAHEDDHEHEHRHNADSLPEHEEETKLPETVHHHKRASHLQLLIAGIMMAVAVAIHNVPEGMSVGAVYAQNEGTVNQALLVLIASIILHNIPEGMAIALPLFTAGIGRMRAAAIAALSGVPTILGALAGYAIGDMGALGMAVSLSFAAGTLLYVVFGEVLPQSINLYCSRKTAFAAITGLIVGLVIIGMHVH